MTHSALDALLALRHAHLIDDPAQTTEIIAVHDADADEPVFGLISEKTHVVATKVASGAYLLSRNITVGDDYEVVPTGVNSVYRFDTADEGEMSKDAQRLFIAQSIENGAARNFAGWRERIVVMIPEEVGAKETNIFRTTADGRIEATHTYNVMTAYGTYAGWVHDLAEEFIGSDEMLEAGIKAPDTTPFGPFASGIVQAWLERNMAEAVLEQARTSLKMGLGAFDMMATLTPSEGASIAELARSLHTDRANLTKVIKSAQKDKQFQEMVGKAKKFSGQ